MALKEVPPSMNNSRSRVFTLYGVSEGVCVCQLLLALQCNNDLSNNECLHMEPIILQHVMSYSPFQHLILSAKSGILWNSE